MPANHPDFELLSAFLDGELPAGGLADARRHLDSCPACSARLEALRTASAALSRLPAEAPDADEHRALRQSILASRGERRWALGWKVLAGATAVMVLIAGFAVFMRTRERTAGTESAKLKAAPVMSLDSDEEVRRALQSDPEVIRALGGSSRAAGPPPQAATAPQQEAADSAAGQESPSGGPGGFSAPDPGADQAQRGSGPGSACLDKVARAQTTPVTPILFRRVDYKQHAAWMLVYALAAPGGPPQAEVWIIPLEACASLEGEPLLARALLYSFLPGSE